MRDLRLLHSVGLPALVAVIVCFSPGSAPAEAPESGGAVLERAADFYAGLKAVRATAENKDAAAAWLARHEAEWNACLDGALREAFRIALFFWQISPVWIGQRYDPGQFNALDPLFRPIPDNPR